MDYDKKKPVLQQMVEKQGQSDDIYQQWNSQRDRMRQQVLGSQNNKQEQKDVKNIIQLSKKDEEQIQKQVQQVVEKSIKNLFKDFQ